MEWKTVVMDKDECSGADLESGSCFNTKMSEIISIVQPPNSNQLWTAGYVFRDQKATPTIQSKKACVMKMDDDGDIKFIKMWGNTDDEQVASSVEETDVARAIAYDERRREIVVLIEVQSWGLRPNLDRYWTGAYADSPNDLLIVRMKESGKVMGGYNINFWDGDISLKIGDNSLFVYENYYIFGGQSYGFNTKQKNVTYDVDNPVFNSFVFKYDFKEEGFNENCFYQTELSGKDLINGPFDTSTRVANYKDPIADGIVDQYQGIFEEFTDQ